MAGPITWKNVSAPDMTGANQGLALAGEFFDRAAEEAEGVAQTFEDQQSELLLKQKQKELLQLQDSLKQNPEQELNIDALVNRFGGETAGKLQEQQDTILGNRFLYDVQSKIEENPEYEYDEDKALLLLGAERAGKLKSEAQKTKTGFKLKEAYQQINDGNASNIDWTTLNKIASAEEIETLRTEAETYEIDRINREVNLQTARSNKAWIDAEPVRQEIDQLIFDRKFAEAIKKTEELSATGVGYGMVQPILSQLQLSQRQQEEFTVINGLSKNIDELVYEVKSGSLTANEAESRLKSVLKQDAGTRQLLALKPDLFDIPGTIKELHESEKLFQELGPRVGERHEQVITSLNAVVSQTNVRHDQEIKESQETVDSLVGPMGESFVEALEKGTDRTVALQEVVSNYFAEQDDPIQEESVSSIVSNMEAAARRAYGNEEIPERVYAYMLRGLTSTNVSSWISDTLDSDGRNMLFNLARSAKAGYSESEAKLNAARKSLIENQQQKIELEAAHDNAKKEITEEFRHIQGAIKSQGFYEVIVPATSEKVRIDSEVEAAEWLRDQYTPTTFRQLLVPSKEKVFEGGEGAVDTETEEAENNLRNVANSGETSSEGTGTTQASATDVFSREAARTQNEGDVGPPVPEESLGSLASNTFFKDAAGSLQSKMGWFRAQGFDFNNISPEAITAYIDNKGIDALSSSQKTQFFNYLNDKKGIDTKKFSIKGRAAMRDPELIKEFILSEMR